MSWLRYCRVGRQRGRLHFVSSGFFRIFTQSVLQPSLLKEDKVWERYTTYTNIYQYILLCVVSAS
jgi:hypothetical protein